MITTILFIAFIIGVVLLLVRHVLIHYNYIEFYDNTADWFQWLGCILSISSIYIWIIGYIYPYLEQYQQEYTTLTPAEAQSTMTIFVPVMLFWSGFMMVIFSSLGIDDEYDNWLMSGWMFIIMACISGIAWNM